MNPFPVFSVRDIRKRFPRFDSRRLVEWQAKGYIQKLRNQYYCFADASIDEPYLHYIAHTIYSPSYVSLESAMERYGMIPEGVFQITSCTTRKTQTIQTPVGTFVYRHIKPELFFGMQLIPWKNYRTALAEPEKTLIDYLYLHSEIQDSDDLQNRRWKREVLHDQIDREKFATYESIISSPALSRRIRLLKEFIDVESE